MIAYIGKIQLPYDHDHDNPYTQYTIYCKTNIP